jgi:hypothetical protein
MSLFSDHSASFCAFSAGGCIVARIFAALMAYLTVQVAFYDVLLCLLPMDNCDEPGAWNLSS